MKELFLERFLSLKNRLYFSWRKSPRKFFVVVTFIVATLGGVYLAIWEGLDFIVSLGGLGTVIVKKIIFILFFILFFMVATSFGVLFYGVGFKSRETGFLLTLPVREEEIVFYKFIEAMVLATWIPFLGLSLFFLAYAQVGRTNALLPLVSLLYTTPFLVISCFFGYLGVLFITRFFNLKKFFLIMVVFLSLGYLFYSHQFKPYQEGLLYFLSEEIAFLRLSKTWFLPFSWPGHGLIYFEDYEFRKSLIYLANLWSLSLFLLLYIHSFKKVFMRIYYHQFSLIHKKLDTKDYLDLIISKVKILPRYMRTFFIKDIKLFLREPSLWLQFLVFFGILFFYFLNLRRLSYHLLGVIWKNLLTFLNTFSILCIVSAMSTRFVFPQWSLEGRNFWILKLTPVSLRKIFREKFILSFTGLFIISELLISVSNYMLKVEDIFFNITLFILFISTFTMVSISLGLGAYFADFKQEYYLKAVESLGGFVTLVTNFGYAFLTVFLFGTITHLYFSGKLANFDGILRMAIILWTILSLGISLFISWWGLRNLEGKEY
jgi:ABC-2 type transport system permease protein